MCRCTGCGVELQNIDRDVLGYTSNLGNNLCERCFRINNYNEYKTVVKSNQDFINILENINKTNDLVVLVVDLFNINKNLEEISKYVSNDILLVLTKRDILPKSCYDKKLLEYFSDYNLNIIDSIIISSVKNYNFDLLYSKILNNKKSNNVYVVGFTNAGKSIARNFSLSMASITCTIITLILVSLGVLVSYNVNNITKDIEKELTIVVFMKKETTKEELNKTKDALSKIDNVADVKYTSKDDIKNDMASEYPSFSKMMESWTDVNNPFQDSYIVSVKDVRDINETVTTIKNLDNVDIVKYSESMIGELINIFDAIKTGTICLVVGLVLVTAFLINNTIKITIFSRRNEIDIMRLVGTSNTVIKLPFLFEGLFIGILGSIIPVLVTIFGYTYIYNALSSLGTSNILSIIKLTSPELIVYKTSLFILIIGAVVGMFGSVKAVRKYLTV